MNEPVAVGVGGAARARIAAVRVVEALTDTTLTVATAESLTAGRVAASLADVPGVSQWLLGGVVAYAYAVKTSLLGVDADLLGREGAVTEEVARQMARGGLDATGADVVVATTGVAGPGPADGHPAGTVWLAVAVRGGAVTTRLLALGGDRDEVRWDATAEALGLLTEIVEQTEHVRR